MTIDTKFATSWIIIVVAIILIGWDIYVMKTKEKGDTISEILLTVSLKHPVVAFLFGVLMGHLFWPQLVTAMILSGRIL